MSNGSCSPMGHGGKARCDVFMRTDAERHADTKNKRKKKACDCMVHFLLYGL